MNRSFSKIRHIQESNIRLEKRMLNEQQQTDIANSLKQKGYSLITDDREINMYNQKLRSLNWTKKDYYSNSEGTKLVTDGQQIYFIVAPPDVRELGPFNFEDINDKL